jgi:hypothetical protein
LLQTAVHLVPLHYVWSILTSEFYLLGPKFYRIAVFVVEGPEVKVQVPSWTVFDSYLSPSLISIGILRKSIYGALKFSGCPRPIILLEIRIGAHRMTPAMAAGVESRLWEIGDIVKVVEAWEAALR